MRKWYVFNYITKCVFIQLTFCFFFFNKICHIVNAAVTVILSSSIVCGFNRLSIDIFWLASFYIAVVVVFRPPEISLSLSLPFFRLLLSPLMSFWSTHTHKKILCSLLLLISIVVVVFFLLVSSLLLSIDSFTFITTR